MVAIENYGFNAYKVILIPLTKNTLLPIGGYQKIIAHQSILNAETIAGEKMNDKQIQIHVVEVRG